MTTVAAGLGSIPGQVELDTALLTARHRCEFFEVGLPKR